MASSSYGALSYLNGGRERFRAATSSYGYSAYGDDGHDDHHDSGHHFGDFGIGVFVLALTFGIIARSSSAGARLVDKTTASGRYGGLLLSFFTRAPYTVLVMLFGLSVGSAFANNHSVFGEGLGDALSAWSRVTPEVLLFTILPILLFESSFSADVHILRHEALQIFMLAGPGVILQSVLIAALSFPLFDYEGWNWYVALMFGSMMSATDPVAVVALVKELGMNARIGTLIEGEGLMNDGSAIVLFNVFKGALETDSLRAVDVVATGFRLALGGPLLGVAIGAATSFLLANVTYNDLQSEVTLTVVGCFSCFLLAEGTDLHVSGVLAVVFCGLYLSFYGRGNISVKVEHSLHAFWHMGEYIADTLIFFVAGVVMAKKITSEEIEDKDWRDLVVLFLALQVIRALNVLFCWPVLQQGYGVTWEEGAVLALGGLRGAVGLCLALTVEEFDDDVLSEKLRSKIVFHTSGVALLSLILNGTCMSSVVKYLKLDRVSKAERGMFDHACIVMERRLERFVETELKKDRFLGDADYAVVWRYVPILSPQQYWDRLGHARIVLGPKEKDAMRAIAASVRLLESGAHHRAALTADGGAQGGDLLGKDKDGGGGGGGAKASPLDPSPPRLLSPTAEGKAMEEDEEKQGKGTAAPPSPTHMATTATGRRQTSTGFFAQQEEGGATATRNTAGTVPPPPPPLPAGDSDESMAARLCSAMKAPMDVTYENIPQRLAQYWHGLHKEYFGYGQHNREHILRGNFNKQGSTAGAGIGGNHPAVAVAAVAADFMPLGERRPTMPVGSGGGGGGEKSRKAFTNQTSFGAKQALARQVTLAVTTLPPSLSASSASKAASKGNSGKAPLEHYEAQRAKAAALAKQMHQRDELAAILEKMNENIEASHALLRQQSNQTASLDDGVGGGGAGGGGGEPSSSSSPSSVVVFAGEGMEKARSRFMQAVRAQYQANHHLGRIRPSVLRTLIESADKQLDHPEMPLCDFVGLESKLTMSPNLQKWAKKLQSVPFVEALLKQGIYVHLAFMIELASEFVRAHTAVDIRELLDGGAVTEQLISENNVQVAKVNDLLKSQLPVFPEITHALKTQTAARQLLMYFTRVVEHLAEEGMITEKEHESIVFKTDEMLIKLHSHPLAERMPERVDMLISADFLRGVALEDVERLAASTSGICTEMFVEPGMRLFKAGDSAVMAGPAYGKYGWFLLVRGNVRCVTPKDVASPLPPATTTASTTTTTTSFNFGGSAAAAAAAAAAASGATPSSSAAAGSAYGAKRFFGAAGRSRSHTAHPSPPTEAEKAAAAWAPSEVGEGDEEEAVRPGATFGLLEQVLGSAFESHFETTSYCHLLFVDAASMLKEASKPGSERLFLALFKATALPFLPRILGVDDKVRDPLSLVTSRDYFGGWESTAYAVTPTATKNKAEIRAQRLRISEARQREGGFLGLGALDGATFLRPKAEEILAAGMKPGQYTPLAAASGMGGGAHGGISSGSSSSSSANAMGGNGMDNDDEANAALGRKLGNFWDLQEKRKALRHGQQDPHHTYGHLHHHHVHGTSHHHLVHEAARAAGGGGGGGGTDGGGGNDGFGLTMDGSDGGGVVPGLKLTRPKSSASMHEEEEEGHKEEALSPLSLGSGYGNGSSSNNGSGKDASPPPPPGMGVSTGSGRSDRRGSLSLRLEEKRAQQHSASRRHKSFSSAPGGGGEGGSSSSLVRVGSSAALVGGMGGGSRAVLMRPGQAEKEPPQTHQWVIELSAAKTYVLLRGHVLGRAQQSVEEAHANHMIDAVKLLANRAGTYDHLNDTELATLMALLVKLQGSPAKSLSAANAPANAVAEGAPNEEAAAPSEPHPLPPGGSSSPGETAAHRKVAGAEVAVVATSHLKQRASNTKAAKAAANGGEGAHAPLSPVTEGHGEEESKEGSQEESKEETLSRTEGNTDKHHHHVTFPDSQDNDKANVSAISVLSEGSSLSGGGGGGDDDVSEAGSDDTEGDEVDLGLLELSGPCLVPAGAAGRVHVTARTVIMELPPAFKAARAALKLLTKYRRTQRRLEFHGSRRRSRLAKARQQSSQGRPRSDSDPLSAALRQLEKGVSREVPEELREGKELGGFELLLANMRKNKRTAQLLEAKGAPSLVAGDKVKVVKPGSSKIGMIASVMDPQWQGLVKVDMAGKTKSYHREHLHKLSANSSMPGGYADLEEGHDALMPHAAPLQVGDRVRVAKPRSSKSGRIASVIDPQWHGLVKVTLDGKVKSYNRAHLHKLAHSESASLDVDVDVDADLSAAADEQAAEALAEAAAEAHALAPLGKVLGPVPPPPPGAADTPRSAFLKQGSEKDNADMLSLFN